MLVEFPASKIRIMIPLSMAYQSKLAQKHFPKCHVVAMQQMFPDLWQIVVTCQMLMNPGF